MTRYCRENPSPRYLALLDLYREMHEKGAVGQNIPAAETFDGRSLTKHAGNIERIVRALGARTILDYGAGKGRQYGPLDIKTPDGGRFPDMRAFWGVESITCYDPAYGPFSELPRARFDGVVTTDVMEHCPAEDIAWIIDEIFGFARRFVYLNVACYPAVKSLPNGENAHCTVEPPAWWIALFDHRLAASPDLRYWAAFDVIRADDRGGRVMATEIHAG